MNIEAVPNYKKAPQNLAEVDKSLSLLDQKVGEIEEKETHGVEFYKEIARKLREYGIEKFKDDIAKSDEIYQYREKITENEWIVRDIPYSSFSMEVFGEKYTVNLTSDGPIAGRYDNNIKEIFINISGCEGGAQYMVDLAKIYKLHGDYDIYDNMSEVIAHEEYHKNNDLNSVDEEISVEVKLLNMSGESYLVGSLIRVYKEILEEDLYVWFDKPYKFGEYGAHTKKYKIYAQALKNVMKNNEKGNELEAAKKFILDNLKTGRIDVNGKKEEKYIEKDGEKDGEKIIWKIRQGYYYNEEGIFKSNQYQADLHKAFASVLTPVMLKEIIEEYKELSEIE